MEHKGEHWLVHEECLYCMYCKMPKDTSQVKMTSKSEKKIKRLALAIVELHWSKGISRQICQ